MRNWEGDIWACLPDYVVVIPTNLEGIMGAGLALQANERYFALQEQYRAWCKECGGIRQKLDSLFEWEIDGGGRLLLLPTKKSWKIPTNLTIVETAYWMLQQWHEANKEYNVAVPVLGAGYGGISAENSERLARKYLKSNKFLFVRPSEEVLLSYRKVR